MPQETLHRRSIRLKGYDYRDGGMYFVTINTHNRERLFGSVENGRMWMNAMGCVAYECWHAIPIHFPFVTLDSFVVMPDHIHGMFYMAGGFHKDDAGVRRGKACLAPTNTEPTPSLFHKPPARSLSSIVGSYKSAVSKHINILRNAPAAPVWQRNYYEHIIRSEEERLGIQRYILNNPLNYDADTHYDVPTIIDHARHI